MKPERIGLTLLDLELFAWIVLLKTGVQAVQRTYAFANFADATEFAAEIGGIAEEHQVFPSLVISTPVAEAVPTLVEVTLAHADLKPRHLALAKAIEVAHLAQMETAGAVETPAVDV